MRYFLIGEKLSHSYSEIIHRYNGFDYSLKEIGKSALKDFINDKNYLGLNVTIPYKKEVIPFLDELSPTAKEIGAVNTIVNKNGVLYGDNTDVFGMDFALKSAGISLKDKNVLILGSGGTKCTAEFLAKREGAKTINCVSRSGQINYENCYSLTGAQIIINATPVGMFPNNGEIPIEIERFLQLEGVLDCVYNPLITELLFRAKKFNVKCAEGLVMLVAQALKAQELWQGTSFNAEKAKEIVSMIKSQKQNFVLIGMPSCGKTSVSKLLAERLNREVIDTDAEIIKRENRSIPEIFASNGEEYFREVEKEIVSQIGKKSGYIIATGGGAVLKEENRKALKQNGTIIYLKRDLDKLVCDDRPLSQKEGVAKLYEERKDIYQSFADFIVDCNGTIEQAVEDIIKL